MNPVFFSGSFPNFSVSVSLQITNDSKDLTSESQNNSLNALDSHGQNNQIENSSKVEWTYVSTQWSKEQIQVLLDAKKQCVKVRGEQIWEDVANRVRAVRPSATAQTCRIKYNRLIKDQSIAEKKWTKDEKTALIGLVNLENSIDQPTPLLPIDPSNTIINRPLKRKIEKISVTKISSEPPLKQQKTSLVTRKSWSRDAESKLREILEKTDKVGNERWIEASQQLGNKTAEQCKWKWQRMKKNNS